MSSRALVTSRPCGRIFFLFELNNGCWKVSRGKTTTSWPLTSAHPLASDTHPQTVPGLAHVRTRGNTRANEWGGTPKSYADDPLNFAEFISRLIVDGAGCHVKHGSQLQWMISAGALLLVVELFQLDFVSSVMPWNMIELVHLWNRSVSLPTAWPEPWQWMVFCQKRGQG